MSIKGLGDASGDSPGRLNISACVILLGLLVPTIQNQELVSEGLILQNQVAMRHERASEAAEHRQNQAEHGEISLIIVIFESTTSRQMEFSLTTIRSYRVV
jgi:hypothetical protein